MSIKVDNVFDYFNETDNYLCGNSTKYLRKQIVSEIIGNPINKNIIDIGCGDGYISIPYLVNNCVTFLDLSGNMLEEVKKNIPVHLINNAEFYNISVEKYSTIKTYDIVLVLGVLAHVENIENCILHISKLTKKNGTCIVQITNSDKYIAKIIRGYSKFKKTINITSGNYETNIIKRYTILDTFLRFGFTLIDEKPYFPTFPGFRFLKHEKRIKFLMKTYNTKLASTLGSELILKFIKTQ